MAHLKIRYISFFRNIGALSCVASGDVHTVVIIVRDVVPNVDMWWQI